MRTLPLGTTAQRICSGIFVWSLGFLQKVSANTIYGGGGPLSGVQATTGLAGIPHDTDPRAVVVRILSIVLSFLALAAVTAVIIAGIYMIVGMGSDDSREKAKKIIQYTLIGLMIVLFSQIIVNLITVYLANQV